MKTPAPTDSDPWSAIETAYEFAMEEIGVATSKVAQALSESKGDLGGDGKECADARTIYEKTVDLYPRMRLSGGERRKFLSALANLRSQLEECERRTSGSGTGAVSQLNGRPLLVSKLELAKRHVAEGTEHVAKQRHLIEELASHGHDVSTAIATLAALEKALMLHFGEVERLQTQLALTPE